MVRTFALAAALCSGFTLAAVAADTPAPQAGAADVPADTATNSATSRDFTAKLSAQAYQNQLRNIAAGRGYVVTSDFSQSGSGHWVARALKDGKVKTVAVKMPPRDLPAFIN